MTVQQITSADQFKEPMGSRKVVVVDFYATWCGPCKALTPIFDKNEKFNDFVFAKIDIDELHDLSTKYGVRGVPTCQLFINGEKVADSVGAKNPRQMEDFVSKGLRS